MSQLDGNKATFFSLRNILKISNKDPSPWVTQEEGGNAAQAGALHMGEEGRQRAAANRFLAIPNVDEEVLHFDQGGQGGGKLKEMTNCETCTNSTHGKGRCRAKTSTCC